MGGSEALTRGGVGVPEVCQVHVTCREDDLQRSLIRNVIRTESVNLVREPLDPGLQVIEDVDIIIHHESVIGQEASPLWLSSLWRDWDL